MMMGGDNEMPYLLGNRVRLERAKPRSAVGSAQRARGTEFATQSGHILSWKLIMKSFLRSFVPFH